MRALAATLFALTLAYTTAHSQEHAMLTPEDKKEIGAVLDRFVDGWKNRDMSELGSTMTDDCDWVNTVGMHWKGKSTVVKAHERLLNTRFKGVNIHGGSFEATAIAPDTALVVWISSIDGFTLPEGPKVPPTDNRGTSVMVKQHGEWLIRSLQNTPIDPVASQHDPGK
jgi:uncharacterized protein (TIGR02246 family)